MVCTAGLVAIPANCRNPDNAGMQLLVLGTNCSNIKENPPFYCGSNPPDARNIIAFKTSGIWPNCNVVLTRRSDAWDCNVPSQCTSTFVHTSSTSTTGAPQPTSTGAPIATPISTPTSTSPGHCNYTTQVGVSKTGISFASKAITTVSPLTCATICCQTPGCVAVVLLSSTCYMKNADQYNNQATVTASGHTFITLINRVNTTVKWTGIIYQTKRNTLQEVPDSSIIQNWIYSQVPESVDTISVVVNPIPNGHQAVVSTSAGTSLSALDIGNKIVASLNDPIACAQLESATGSTVDPSSITVGPSGLDIVGSKSELQTDKSVLMGIGIGVLVFVILVAIVLVTVVKKEKEKNSIEQV